MNIAIEARALSAKSGGVKTYTYELLKHLALLHPESQFEFLYGSQSPVNSFPQAKETIIPLHTEVLLPLWMNTVSRYIATKKPNVVHYTKAAIPNKKTVPTIVTIHDIIPVLFPSTQSPLRRFYWPRALKHAAQTADHIMTISETSKRDIMKHFGINEKKITITPLAVDLVHFRPSTSAGRLPTGQAGSEQAPYILFVGTRDARKNISSLVRAFSKIANTIPHQLIIVGKPAKKQDDSKEVVRELHLEQRVEFREDVSYAQLPAIYSGADIFVWPSLYEGWGFPPQEAMACGTPVIVSDGGPLPEVVGDAGVIVPLHESEFIDRLSHEILSLLQDDERKKDLIQRGFAQVQKHSWENVASKTWEVYKKISI